MSDLPPKPVAVDGAKLRLYRMAKVAEWLLEVKRAPPRKAEASLMLKGLTRRTAKAIINDMVSIGLLKLNNKTLEVSEMGLKWLHLLRQQEEF